MGNPLQWVRSILYMIDIYQVTSDELTRWLEERGQPAYRRKQILEWVYHHLASDWSEMKNLSLDLRKKLSESFRIGSLSFVRKTESDDQETTKFLWRLKEGTYVESVLIRSGARRTVCVSSQVGCPARCAFCASGQKGFMRNLSAGEIVEQVMRINQELADDGERVSHIVYMGMGEPLKNTSAVLKSIQQLSRPELLNLSQRRITVSTVGIVEGIHRMIREDLKVSLVLSLHAPNQHVRKKIIPYARKYPLEDILDSVDEYSRKTKRNATYEYILIAGINDQVEHADELSRLLKGKHCTVNLIPYNPVPGVRLKRPSTKTIHHFMSILKKNRLPVTCRYTKGDDIAAACGQLALQEEAELAS